MCIAVYAQQAARRRFLCLVAKVAVLCLRAFRRIGLDQEAMILLTTIGLRIYLKDEDDYGDGAINQLLDDLEITLEQEIQALKDRLEHKHKVICR